MKALNIVNDTLGCVVYTRVRACAPAPAPTRVRVRVRTCAHVHVHVRLNTRFLKNIERTFDLKFF